MSDAANTADAAGGQGAAGGGQVAVGADFTAAKGCNRCGVHTKKPKPGTWLRGPWLVRLR